VRHGQLYQPEQLKLRVVEFASVEPEDELVNAEGEVIPAGA
jgi:hypothetical protein